MSPYAIKLLNAITLSLIVFSLSGCSAPVRFNNISVNHSGRTHYASITAVDKQKIRRLANDISNLSRTVDKTEAYLVAYEAVLYPKVLANQYQLMSPAKYHNRLVNTGIREKGHCYHFAQDLMKHLNRRPYKTLTLQRVMAYQGKPLEHHVPSIRAKGQGLHEAIVLDAWINSSNLFWVQIKNDKGYPWVKYVPKRAKNNLVFSRKRTIIEAPKT